MIAQLQLLLSYSERFYNRQFLTLRHVSHKIVEKLEVFLNDYFASDTAAYKGIPSVQHTAQQLNVSPKYLSGLLKAVTGQSTQQHIRNKIIEKAKEKLSTTDLSVSEIAYQLGFEYSQSLKKLFVDTIKAQEYSIRNETEILCRFLLLDWLDIMV